MSEGWIKLYRKSLDHWLYNESRPHTRREAWEDMLLLCNHDNTKTLVHGELIESKRGQSIMSLKSWAKHFKWSIQKVRTFFDLLKKDSMIEVEGLQKTTRITICKYDDYQNKQHTDNTQITHEQHTDNTQIDTNKNDKNDNNGKNIDLSKIQKEFFDSLIPFASEFDKQTLRDFYEYWSEPNKSGKKIRMQLEKTWDTKKRLTRWANNGFSNIKPTNGQSKKFEILFKTDVKA